MSERVEPGGAGYREMVFLHAANLPQAPRVGEGLALPSGGGVSGPPVDRGGHREVIGRIATIP
ncbi:MAG: hypothetical protein OER90_15055, partial [Gemmatimonadota bacterium]|nr:hypothetical protein [Gemmatimonadota bacterium]